MDRRKFINLGGIGISSFTLSGFIPKNLVKKPIVISTWDAGIAANQPQHRLAHCLQHRRRAGQGTHAGAAEVARHHPRAPDRQYRQRAVRCTAPAPGEQLPGAQRLSLRPEPAVPGPPDARPYAGRIPRHATAGG